MSAASKKSTTKPAAKKAASKSTPSHPSWVDMIKVSSILLDMNISHRPLCSISNHTVVVVVWSKVGPKRAGRRACTHCRRHILSSFIPWLQYFLPTSSSTYDLDG